MQRRVFWGTESVLITLQKKMFELNFLFRQNASEFAIFIEKENACSFFILSNFEFYLINALVYVDIDQNIHKIKTARNENEKNYIKTKSYSLKAFFLPIAHVAS